MGGEGKDSSLIVGDRLKRGKWRQGRPRDRDSLRERKDRAECCCYCTESRSTGRKVKERKEDNKKDDRERENS